MGVGTTQFMAQLMKQVTVTVNLNVQLIHTFSQGAHWGLCADESTGIFYTTNEGSNKIERYNILTNQRLSDFNAVANLLMVDFLNDELVVTRNAAPHVFTRYNKSTGAQLGTFGSATYSYGGVFKDGFYYMSDYMGVNPNIGQFKVYDAAFNNVSNHHITTGQLMYLSVYGNKVFGIGPTAGLVILDIPTKTISKPGSFPKRGSLGHTVDGKVLWAYDDTVSGMPQPENVILYGADGITRIAGTQTNIQYRSQTLYNGENYIISSDGRLFKITF
jgi:hypothetical protein